MKLIFSSLCFVLFISACTKEDVTLDHPVVKPIETTVSSIPIKNLTILKSGEFNNAGGYPTKGIAQLVKDSINNFAVRLGEDFSTTFATGSVTMYLSNSMNLKLSEASTFIKLAVIDKKGSHFFALESQPKDELKFVIVWCQPAGIKFGYAELK